MAEEDRRRRLRKRISGVLAIRNSADYIFLADLWERGLILHLPGPTNYPADECVSKRSWEKGQQHWRHQIRRWALLYGYVPAGAATSASTQSARSIAVIPAVFRPQDCVCDYCTQSL